MILFLNVNRNAEGELQRARKLCRRDKRASCQGALADHHANLAVRVAHAKPCGPVNAICVGGGLGHCVEPVEVGPIAVDIPPGTVDNLSTVAVAGVMVNILCGKGLPSM